MHASRRTQAHSMLAEDCPTFRPHGRAVAASAACWQLGDRLVYRWRHRPRRRQRPPSLGRSAASLPHGGSPRGARPPARGVIGSCIGSAVRRRPCAASSSVRPRLPSSAASRRACGRRQAGRSLGRQVKLDVRAAPQGAHPRADRSTSVGKGGGGAQPARIHAARGGPRASLMTPYEWAAALAAAVDRLPAARSPAGHHAGSGPDRRETTTQRSIWQAPPTPDGAWRRLWAMARGYQEHAAKPMRPAPKSMDAHQDAQRLRVECSTQRAASSGSPPCFWAGYSPRRPT